MRLLSAIGIALVVLTSLSAQDKSNKPDQAKIDEAINKGCKFLLTQYDWFTRSVSMTWEPTSPGSTRHNLMALGVLTLKHGGVDENDPTFQKMVAKMTNDTIETTYFAALQACALQKIDPVKYQAQIAKCAQYLIDTQCKNGQWCYGHPMSIEIPAPKEESARGGNGGGNKFSTGKKDKEEPVEEPKKVTKYYLVRKNNNTCPQGDNSNSQYAALGLRAAMESGVMVPVETLQLAVLYWEKAQRADGGWTYGQPDMVGGRKINDPFSTKESYGSMTIGGYSAVAIYKYLLKQDYKRDPRIMAASNWIGKNWTVTENPGNPKFYHFYFLYGIERGGDLVGNDKFGGHFWYAEGAKWLLDNQKGDGSWLGPTPSEEIPVIATCFAILFLKRATVPLIKTEAAPAKK